MTTSHSEPIRLLLAEFEDIVSRGLRALIGEDRRLALVASGIRAPDLRATLTESKPDVAILNFGALSSPSVLRDLHAAFPSTRLVVLADPASLNQCCQLAAFGASVCLAKSADAPELLRAIHNGSREPMPAPQLEAAESLTQSEAEVLELLRGGRSNAEIAATLHVGFETVRIHTSSIYRKLGVSCRRELRSREAALVHAHHGAP